MLEPLQDLVASTHVSLLVLTPQCHYPTGAVLSPARREAVLALAREHRIPILELDTEYDYLSSPPRPLAAEDSTGQVIYVGSLSRVFAPGIRLGFMATPQALADRLAKARQRLDWQGDPLLEWAISELLLDGEHQRQLRRIRKAALERREALGDSLRHALGDRLHFDGKRAGMGLWLQGRGVLEDPERFDLWIKACAMKGVKLRKGRAFRLQGELLAATRLGYTAHTPEELQQAVVWMT
jgi:GntR family transcriptional regulator/MocR family aminotransferase